MRSTPSPPRAVLLGSLGSLCLFGSLGVLVTALTLAITLVAAPRAHAQGDAPADPAAPIRIDLPNACVPAPKLLTGGQPTGAHLDEARAKGFVLVVNLRSEAEGPAGEQAQVEALGLRYISIPIAGAQDLTVANARRLAHALEAAGDRPVLVHCASGNRVGALFALKAFHLDGKTADEALAIGRAHGLTGLEPQVRERLRKE